MRFGSRVLMHCSMIGARAAQVVPHVHFHIIPRMEAPSTPRSWTMFGRGRREDLDFDEAEALAKRLREQMKVEIDVAFRNSSMI
jgi:diadenosine tetraphosphate (Ap4A) HIT family hydrolase